MSRAPSWIERGIAHVSFARLVRAMLPFYVPLVIALLMLTYLPELSLWLPRFVKAESRRYPGALP